jgi:aspartate kinase
MAVIVQKYGGSSVATPELIEMAARNVAESRRAGHDVVVVVSAMGGETDRLIGLARSLDPKPSARELDVLLTTGEQVSIALLAIALGRLGVPARSFTGAQAGITTDGDHGNARITDVRPSALRDALTAGRVAVVAGFQGVAEDTGETTTLGRGGSDTTAVALAAALDAAVCEIITDVDGVYTADPRVVADARPLPSITYEEMLEMAAAGAKVLMQRSVAVARRMSVPVQVKRLGSPHGTWITTTTQRNGGAMENAVISGVTHDSDVVAVAVRVPASVQMTEALSESSTRLADAGVPTKLAVQSGARVTEQGGQLTYCVPASGADAAVEALRGEAIAAEPPVVDTDVALVTVIGSALSLYPGCLPNSLGALRDAAVTVKGMVTSETRITFMCEASAATRAVAALHSAFALNDRAA